MLHLVAFYHIQGEGRLLLPRSFANQAVCILWIYLFVKVLYTQ